MSDRKIPLECFDPDTFVGIRPRDMREWLIRLLDGNLAGFVHQHGNGPFLALDVDVTAIASYAKVEDAAQAVLRAAFVRDVYGIHGAVLAPY